MLRSRSWLCGPGRSLPPRRGVHVFGLCLFLSPAVFDREQHTLNLPAVNSITYVLRFLEKLCHNLRSDNLFGSQPFSQNSHMQRSHDHDRYLPGRSWGGGGAVGTQVLRVLTQVLSLISRSRALSQGSLHHTQCRAHALRALV